MIISIPVPAYIIFSYDPFWVKIDIGTGIHMDYNCTIGSIFVALVFADLPSLSLFIFYTCSTNFSSLRQTYSLSARAHQKVHNTYVRAYACALAQTARSRKPRGPRAGVRSHAAGRRRRRRWTNREFRRFSYRARTWPFGMLKVRVVNLEYS